MRILAVAGVVGVFALICVVIYLVGRSLQRRGRDLSFVDPAYPDSMQAVQPNVKLSVDDGNDGPPNRDDGDLLR